MLRALLLEPTSALAEAERILRISLLAAPQQPDAIQHFLRLRQKMSAWPVLDETIPGLSHQDLLAQRSLSAALALTDRVAELHAIAAHWIAHKTTPVPDRLRACREINESRRCKNQSRLHG